jgi:uncharacterized peroxidase-related enzyme
MPFFSYLAPESTIGDLLQRDNDRMIDLSRFTEAVLHGPSPLTPGQRELIAAYVSSLNECQFCHRAHTAFAESHGMDMSAFNEPLDRIESAAVDESLKPILRFVRKLTETPSKMTQADADEVLGAGWDEQALQDAILVASLFNFYNRYVEGHGIDPAPMDVCRQVGSIIKEKGYMVQHEQSF